MTKLNNYVVDKIERLMTLEPAMKKGARRPSTQDYGFIDNAVLVIKSGKVAWVGPRLDLPREFKKFSKRRALGGLVMPGLIDPHTHLVFAGDRSQEFEMRLGGATYQEIAASGGGIKCTMNSTRQASATQLLKLARERLEIFLKQGVTTVEIKSGYGLTLKDETKCLEVAKRLGNLKKATVIKTFLGAHALPPEFDQGPSKEQAHHEYVRTLAYDWLPKLCKKKLVDHVDIFVDEGYFSANEARVLLSAALLNGVQIKIHSDEFKSIGGTDVAIDMNALSADHLLAISEASARRLAQSETTAVLLPTTALFLRAAYAPARKLLDLGARVALGSDFNPGSSPTQDLSLVGILAATQMQMTVPEIVVGHTLAASFALGLQKQKGVLIPGYDADFIELDAASPAELFYRFGQRMGPRAVTHQGRQVV